MLYGQDYVFSSPIALRGTMIKHQDDRTQHSIDLMTLEFALYNRYGHTLFKGKLNWNINFHSNTSTAKPASNSKVRHIRNYHMFSTLGFSSGFHRGS